MQGARICRWGIAALLVFSSAAWAAGPIPCPKGTQRIHDKSGYWCKKVEGGGGSTEPESEKDAWAALDKSLVTYHQQDATYQHAKLEAEGAENKLKSMNCLQFKCPSQDTQDRLAAANTQMSYAGAAIQKAIDQCNGAKKAIEAAREKEGTGHWYRTDKPICPTGPGQITTQCPKGMHRHFEKCVKN